jgi:6-pyruvoyltetrahydropterin/6-carboxytetrahydropterin synthase
MFEIDIERAFSAAHFLKGYQGDCSSLHGHNWTVQVILQVKELDEIGIAFDFREVKKHLDKILDEFDHKCLNELPYFEGTNPTSEMLAKTIFELLEKQLEENIVLSRVRVCESPGSGATYIK